MKKCQDTIRREKWINRDFEYRLIKNGYRILERGTYESQTCIFVGWQVQSFGNHTKSVNEIATDAIYETEWKGSLGTAK